MRRCACEEVYMWGGVHVGGVHVGRCTCGEVYMVWEGPGGLYAWSVLASLGV